MSEVGLNFVDYPNDCINLMGECFELCFQTGDMTKTRGGQASTVIPASFWDDIVDGTQVKINGIIFTYRAAGTAVPQCNEINIQSSGFVTGFATFQAASFNSQLSGCFTFSYDGIDLNVTATDCNKNIEVELCELGNDEPDRSISEQGKPLSLVENYSICLEIQCGTFPIELTVPVKPLVVNCQFIRASACVDIGCLLSEDPQIRPAGPSCEVLGGFTEIAEQNFNLCCELTIKYAEAYGDPVNYYLQSFFRGSITTYAGTQTPQGYPDYSQWFVCDPVGFTNIELMSMYEDGDVLCHDQCVFLYHPIQFAGFHNITFQMVLCDRAGNILLDTTNLFPALPIFNGQSDVCVLTINAGLCQLADFLAVFGFTDFSEVAQVKYTIVDTAGLSVVTSTKTLDFECCDCSEEFVFISPTMNIWGTITTKCFDSLTYTVAKKFVSNCRACDPSDLSKNASGLTSELSKEFEVFIDTEKWNENIICEFLNSKEVYWRYDGRLYFVQPSTNSYNVVENGNNENISFKFRLESKKAF